jgi:uncharacterized membrane protein YqjE
MTGPAPGGGLLQSLRRLADTAVGIAQVRLELFGTELEQEKQRVFDALVWAALGLLMAGLALVLAIGFVVLLFQEGYRLGAVGVLALVFGGGGWWALRHARARLHAGTDGPFALSLSELRRDRQALSDGGSSREGP